MVLDCDDGCFADGLVAEDDQQLACTLEVLGGGQPGTVTWSIDLGTYGQNIELGSIIALGDGTAIAAGAVHEDFAMDFLGATQRRVAESGYFATCAEQSTAFGQLSCVRAGIEDELAFCEEPYSGSFGDD